MRNSEFLANLGGAIVIPESELNPDFLAKAILNFDRASLSEMGVKAKLADMFGATTLVGQQIEDLMR
jgi:UDP-N-acetylglucosamine:LPS N-acetylglucosamine transferase